MCLSSASSCSARVIVRAICVAPPLVREKLKEMTKNFDKSEDDLKSLQSGVGQVSHFSCPCCTNEMKYALLLMANNPFGHYHIILAYLIM